MVEVTRRVDGAKVRIPLAGPANRQGRIAATNALGGSMKYSGALGTSGCSRRWTTRSPRRGFRKRPPSPPGSAPAPSTSTGRTMRATTPATASSRSSSSTGEDGRLLGAQAFGKEGVEKRIDVPGDRSRGADEPFGSRGAGPFLRAPLFQRERSPPNGGLRGAERPFRLFERPGSARGFPHGRRNRQTWRRLRRCPHFRRIPQGAPRRLDPHPPGRAARQGGRTSEGRHARAPVDRGLRRPLGRQDAEADRIRRRGVCFRAASRA